MMGCLVPFLNIFATTAPFSSFLATLCSFVYSTRALGASYIFTESPEMSVKKALSLSGQFDDMLYAFKMVRKASANL